MVDLLRIFCKLTLEEEMGKTKFKSKKEKFLTQSHLEDFAAGLLENIEKNLKNNEK